MCLTPDTEVIESGATGPHGFCRILAMGGWTGSTVEIIWTYITTSTIQVFAALDSVIFLMPGSLHLSA